MTNEAIIMEESLRLVEQGVLATTGKKVKTIDGIELELPEAIHTFQKWKELGFSVKKGEKAIAKFPIWKHSSKTVEVDGEEEVKTSMFMKTAAFFKFSQVERIAQGH